jgi:hypothetical protein
LGGSDDVAANEEGYALGCLDCCRAQEAPIGIFFYKQVTSMSKVPLFDEKSGTLLIEKRHFTSRKAVLCFS